MGKLRVMVGTGALVAATMLAWGGVAQAEVVDYTPTVQVEAVSQTRTPAAVAPTAAPAGQLPYTGNGSSLPLAELGAGLLAAGGLAVVLVRTRRAA